MSVLGAEEGLHPNNSDKTVCNTLKDGNRKLNFLTKSAYWAFIQTKKERENHSTGIFEENRLLNNLLSSQPLCFNFFGELKSNTNFAATILQQWIPSVKVVEWIKFEFAPPENYSQDGSAFDVAIQYITKDDKKGLLGLECKYTDDFSTSGKDRPAYQNIFKKNADTFLNEYKSYLKPKYVQLFRNQLIGEALINFEGYSEVYTGLFCHHDDLAALGVGRDYQKTILNGETRFKIISYREFITQIQRLPLTWNQREWTMKLWARYCGLGLSERLYNEVNASESK